MEDKLVERRFKAIEEQQIETERTLEKHTETLKDLSDEQKAQGELLMKTFKEVGQANTNIGMLQQKMEVMGTDMQGVKADIIAIKESQADFRDRQQEHGKRFDGIDEMLKEILARLPKKGED